MQTRILIIEDHVLVREALALTLAQVGEGVHCQQASNATDALALLGPAESPTRAPQAVPVIYGGTNNPRLDPAGNSGPDTTLSAAATHDQG